MGDEKGIVVFRDAAGYIGRANALLRIIRRKRLDELARDATLILLREQMPCLRAGDGETPAGWLHQIVFDTRTRHRFSVDCAASSELFWNHPISTGNYLRLSWQPLPSATPSGNCKDHGKSARIGCWIDGRKKITIFVSTVMDQTFSPNGVAAGKHRFDFFAVNTAGTKWQKTVYATVQ